MASTDAAMDIVVHPSKWLGLRPWGRHSLVLAVAGFMYFCLGIVYMNRSPRIGPDSLIVAQEWFPIKYWGILWIVIGVATIVSSRWPPTADRWGYSILTGWSAGWGAFYGAGVIFESTPIGNLATMFVFFLVAFLWWAISGLTNPTKLIVEIVEVKTDVG